MGNRKKGGIKEYRKNHPHLRCARCCTQQHVEIHHIVLFAQSHNSEERNLIPLCHSCHHEYHRYYGKSNENERVLLDDFMQTIPVHIFVECSKHNAVSLVQEVFNGWKQLNLAFNE